MAVEVEAPAPVCQGCGSGEFAERPHELHGSGLWCADCGRFFKWVGKGGRIIRRNDRWRGEWRALGTLICQFCGITEAETTMGFEIDHIIEIEDGGRDEFANTRPLCSNCHWIRNAQKYRVKHERRRRLEDAA